MAAFEWYAERSVAAAEGFREELRHAVEMVSTAPGRWPRFSGRTRRYVFPRFPYSLVYRMFVNDVEVVAVAHGKRRPGYWRSRLRRAP